MCARYTVPRVPRTTVPGRFTFHMYVGNESLDIVHIHYVCMYVHIHVCMYVRIVHMCTYNMNDECTNVFFNARFSLGPEDPTFGTFQCTPLPNPETSRCWSQCLDTVNNFAAARCSLHSAFHRLASLCTGDMDYDWTRGTIVTADVCVW
jgi:hypothetical protein